MIGAFVSTIMGMIILGSCILRFRTFDTERIRKPVIISLFVYASFGLGAILTNRAETYQAMTALFGELRWHYDSEQVGSITSILMLISVIVSIAMTWGNTDHLGFFDFSGRWNAMIERLTAYFGVFIALSIATALVLFTFSSKAGMFLIFFLLLALIAISNVVLGIVMLAINLAFAVHAAATNSHIDLLSLFGIIEFLPGQSEAIFVFILIVSSIVGCIELSLQLFDKMVNGEFH